MLRIILLILFLVRICFPQSINLVKEHAHYLADDIFGGRGTGQLGGELAAKYIAFKLNEFGIFKLPQQKSFYQYIPLHGVKVDEKSTIKINGNKLSYGKDFLIDKLGETTFNNKEYEVVFVGYGIDAPELKYSDYNNVDVEGKIALFYDGLPDVGNSGNLIYYSYLDIKRKIALSKGAIGSICVPVNKIRTNDWTRLILEYSFEDVNLAYMPKPSLSIILNPNSLNKNMNFYNGLKSEYIPSFRLSTEIKYSRRDFMSPNVVGVIEGNSPLSKELIVISAHYDHLGIGRSVEGDSVYNGFTDNALGVALLLELGRLLVLEQNKLMRSVILLFTTAEEKGLLGARYFIDHFPRRDNLVANINIDGVPVFDEFNSVIAFGKKETWLYKAFQKYISMKGLKVDELNNKFNITNSNINSDQYAFMFSGIPSLLILDGFNHKNKSEEMFIQKTNEYFMNRYHSPFDDLNEKVNYNAVFQYLNLLKDFILELSVKKN